VIVEVRRHCDHRARHGVPKIILSDLETIRLNHREKERVGREINIMRRGSRGRESTFFKRMSISEAICEGEYDFPVSSATQASPLGEGTILKLT